MLWLLILLPVAGAVYGFVLLHAVCSRRDREEGWEDKRVAESGDAVWKSAWDSGRDWLDKQETEDVEVQSEDGFMLHALLVPHIFPLATVLLFHGWRSSAEMDFLCLLPFLHSLRLQCLLIDERAQGDSEGQYTTFGVRERLDVPVWAEYAANRFGREHPLILQGLSMGASVVLMASDAHFDANVRGVVADCGFTTPYEIVSAVWRNKTPLPSHFSVWLLDCYTRLFAGFSLRECSSLDALKKTKLPVLFIHGAEDKFVPSYMTRQMYDACSSEKSLLMVEGAGHCMSFLTGRAQYEEAYKAFAEKILNRHLP
ncbi:MAG: alpha/beta hydrolase [Oscillospiraceae bacterium]|nr:alpha/beta hydrolase [Oscillospiraceae bacterium]